MTSFTLPGLLQKSIVQLQEWKMFKVMDTCEIDAIYSQ